MLDTIKFLFKYRIKSEHSEKMVVALVNEVGVLKAESTSDGNPGDCGEDG